MYILYIYIWIYIYCISTFEYIYCISAFEYILYKYIWICIYIIQRPRGLILGPVPQLWDLKETIRTLPKTTSQLRSIFNKSTQYGRYKRLNTNSEEVMSPQGLSGLAKQYFTSVQQLGIYLHYKIICCLFASQIWRGTLCFFWYLLLTSWLWISSFLPGKGPNERVGRHSRLYVG